MGTARPAFDPLGGGNKQVRGPAPPLQKREENSPEDLCRELERQVRIDRLHLDLAGTVLPMLLLYVPANAVCACLIALNHPVISSLSTIQVNTLIEESACANAEGEIENALDKAKEVPLAHPQATPLSSASGCKERAAAVPRAGEERTG